MSDNLLTITSAKNFQETLSKDLERVSVTNFWAPWAEPCKQMNEVVAALAKEHPSILFLQVKHVSIYPSFHPLTIMACRSMPKIITKSQSRLTSTPFPDMSF